MKVDKVTIKLIQAEALRIIDILDNLKFKEDGELSYYEGDNYSLIAEYKQKSKELRRDTVRLSKQF